MLFQVRIHGRGGQGVVTAAELLSVAAFREGRHAQAFPSFGSERTGAPVVAFCRISDHEIRAHEPVASPDALIIQDPTLLHQVDLFRGLPETGYLLINSSRGFSELGFGDLAAKVRPERAVAVPATEIAREMVGRPIANAVLLGGFAALTEVISLASVVAAIRDRFSGALAEGNVAGAERAYELVRQQITEVAGAHAD
ncbi:MAG: 2-oxoacid:acceptor oxidoreductase family protein [Candidatus Dormiibacterota bacterium]